MKYVFIGSCEYNYHLLQIGMEYTVTKSYDDRYYVNDLPGTYKMEFFKTQQEYREDQINKILQ